MRINKSESADSTIKEKRVSPELERLLEDIEIGMGNDNGTENINGVIQKREDTLYIPFSLGSIRFAVPLFDTIEVVKSMNVTPLPNLPVWLKGIGNIRGEVISVVDLKVFFGSAPESGKTDEFIIVLKDKEIKTGIIVDRLMGVRAMKRTDSGAVDNPYPDGDIREFINGIIIDETGVVNILDTGSLLGSERMNRFGKSKEI